MMHLRRLMGAGANIGGWSPYDIPGVERWYDPSDLSTIWQDAAATTPVTSAGQGVYRIDNKINANGNLIAPVTGADPDFYDVGGIRALDFSGGQVLYSEYVSAILNGGGFIAVAWASDL